MLDGSPYAESAREGCHFSSGDTAHALDHLAKAQQAFVEAGCDVIRTPTSGLPRRGLGLLPSSGRLLEGRWVDLARATLEVARDATRLSPAVVAFTVGSQVDGPEGEELRRVLGRLVEKTPPDLLLVQSLTIVRPSLLEAVDALVALGLPVWLSFRRCVEGLCGPSGHHWPDAGIDEFGRAAMELERRGATALLINCVPCDHVDGTFERLRYFTDLPLGVLPNTTPKTSLAMASGKESERFADYADSWQAEGAQIIGGCCGVDAAMLGEVRRRSSALRPAEGSEPGLGRPSTHLGVGDVAAAGRAEPWCTPRGRPLFPVPMPRLPTGEHPRPTRLGELLLWEHLYKEGIGANQRCLQMGSANGMLGAQLALNGASHVHAVERDEEAVDAILETAFLNGMTAVLTAEVADISCWEPSERYEVVVASLEEPWTDPSDPDPYAYDFDPWGRRRLDALIARLPVLLAREGVAYLAQCSLLSQRRTVDLLSAASLEANVVDWHLWPAPSGSEFREHVEAVTKRSDAFWLRAPQPLVAVYLIEVRRANAVAP